MDPFIAIIFATTLAAAYVGALRLRALKVIIAILVLSISAWIARCAILVLDPPDVTDAEGFFNGLTLGHALSEIAVCALWLGLWLGVGFQIARFARALRNVR